MRHCIEARTFHGESDLSRSVHAVQLTEHLIPGQIWAFEDQFFELATRGTNDDLHGIFSCRVEVRLVGLGMRRFPVHLECHSGSPMNESAKLLKMRLL